MKNIVLIIFFLCSMFYFVDDNKHKDMINKRTFYDHNIRLIDGSPFDLTSLKGKKLMIVNVASKCGLTSQYQSMQELYDEHGGSDFEILAFPSNDFANQEPGSSDEIIRFCSENYGVTFLVFEKISVKSGDDQHPIYEWLCNKALNNKKNISVKWNFQKFLIDEEGNWIDYLLPTTSPKSKKIISWLRK